ncbi:MAG: glycosyltransferase family 2 protein [Pirellulaceae bacterium]|nr:glycosyltransferase family 2 protein [Pirellulaceae bacterium]
MAKWATTPRPSETIDAAASRPRASQTSSVEIALATYNSETYLAELLNSLFAQTSQQFMLIVSDDGSSDSTLDILHSFGRREPGRIRVLPPTVRRLGPIGNFSRLLDHASADYLLLCDHDDVWLPNKLALSIERMVALEAVHPEHTSLLVHTDLVVVGPKLEVLSTSCFRYSNVDPRRSDLTSLLTANIATGCASLINRALYQRARPIPPQAMMHDHWLALVAAALGAISFIDQPTILYRQHGSNLIGVEKKGGPLIRRVARTLFGDEQRRMMIRYSRQAAALLRRCGGEMSADARRRTETLANLWTLSRWRRLVLLRQSGLRLQGFVRNVALLIVVFRGRRTESDEP